MARTKVDVTDVTTLWRSLLVGDFSETTLATLFMGCKYVTFTNTTGFLNKHSRLTSLWTGKKNS